MTPDPAMEIACTLTCEPCYASLPELIKEFGLPTQAALRKLLAKAGIDYAIGRTGKNATSIYIPRKWWVPVQRACEKYWRTVYGE